MSLKRRRGFRQFFTGLTILSVTFTQAVPAFALRPGIEGKSQAGLEEVLSSKSTSPVGTVDISRLDPEVALHYLAWQTSRHDPHLAAAYYDHFQKRQGKSDCRVCSMRGNVLQGIPRMLHLMLTGGYDGAGIAIKANINGKYFLILVKERGHLDALLQGMFNSIDQQLKALVASEYGVPLEQVRPIAANLGGSFEIDPAFGDEVFRMWVGDRTVSIPMEAIGHTRWATVGKPSALNSHPFHKRIPKLQLPDARPFEVVLAHNGNFNSYDLFRPITLTLGAEIVGETDSEVLALIAGFMHRGQTAETPIVPIQQATERMLRFVKYVEDWGALLNLLEQQTEEAGKYHAAALNLLRAEMSAWGVQISAGMVEADLLMLAKQQVDRVIGAGLATPWLFDAPEAGGRLDVARSLSASISSDKKDQAKFRQKFFDPYYSSLAITLMNNAEDGIIVARGRTGGDIEVYAPPLWSVAQRLGHEIPKLEKAALPTDVDSARSRWLPYLRDLVQQMDASLSAAKNADLWLPPAVYSQLERLQQRAADLYHRVERLPSNAVLDAEKEKILALSKEIKEFTQVNGQKHDPGRRIAASEKRAIPGIPGTARVHPEERFRKAGRGEMDVSKVDMGQVVHMAREIRWSSVWDDELKTPVSEITPERGMVDIANVELGGADSRLEREIGNQVAGWGNTLDQFREGIFPDLNYSDVQLGDIQEWIFVAEGTSNHLAQLAAMVASVVPKGRIHFRVMSGKDFQAMVSSGHLETIAKELAKQKKKVMITNVSNTGQTETLRNGIQQLNVLNQRLAPEEQVLPSIITNVAGSAIDLEISKFDGNPHAVYTLVGYEAAVPATGSLNVGVIAAGLYVMYVQAVQKALPGGRAEFFGRITKFDAATEHMKRVVEQGPDGALHVKPEYQEYLENVFGRLDPTALAPLVWIMGWWIWRVGAAEARLKLQEGFRSATVSDWDVISGKHGPYAILRPGTTAIAFLPSSKAFREGFDMVSQGLKELRSRVDASEAGGARGNLIVLMDAEDYAKKEILKGISDLADVIVPLPDMDDPFTGFMTSSLFMQLVTLYGARARFEPVRQTLIKMDERIQRSGILHKELSMGPGQPAEVFHNSAELLLAFSGTLSDLRTVAESEGRKVLTELATRDPEYFKTFRQEAQRPGKTATEVALDVTNRLAKREIGGHLETPAWKEIRRYADGSNRRIQQIRERLEARREALHTALQKHGIAPDELARDYLQIDAYSLSPSEAIRFAGDRRSWREYTETYIRHLSKQISGVEARFDAATRELLRGQGISQELLDTTLRGLLRIEGGRIQAYPGVLDLVSRLTGRSQQELLRTALHHEGAEFLFRIQEGVDDVLREALRWQTTPDELQAFRSRFEEAFGEVDEENWPYEVAAQYYTARFTDDADKLNRTFGQAVGRAIKDAAGDLDGLLTVRPRGGEDAKQAHIRALRQVAQAVTARSRGTVDLSIKFNDRIAEVDVARAQVAVQEIVAAGYAGVEERQEINGRINRLIGEIVHRINLYGQIVRGSTSVPTDAPFPEQLGDVTQRLGAHRFEEARLLLQQFIAQLRGLSPESMSAVAIVASLMRILEQAEELVNELSLIAPASDPVEAQIRRLIEAFQRTRMVQFSVVELPGPPPQAMLLLVGPPRAPRTHHALIHDVSEKGGINISHIETRELPGSDVDMVTVDATVQQLDDLRILEEIRERLRRLFPSQEELDLIAYLRNRNFSDAEINWLSSLYGPYRSAPLPRVRLDVEELEGTDQTYLAALVPFAPPEGLDALDVALRRAIDQSSQQSGKAAVSPNTVRVEMIQTPGGGLPVALVLMDFNINRHGLSEVGVFEVIEGVLQQYAGQPRTFVSHNIQIFLEQRASNPEDRRRLTEAFSRLEQEPEGVLFTHPVGKLTYIVAAIPFQQAAGLPAELNVGLLEGVQELAQKRGIRIRPERLFVAQYQETPVSPPIALIQVAFLNELVADQGLNLVGQIQEILRPYTRQLPPPQTAAPGTTGLEEGVDYRLDDDDNAVFLKPTQITSPSKISNGITLNPQGSSIVVGKDTMIFKGATLKGPTVIGSSAEVGGILVGTVEKPLVIGNGAKIHRAEANVKESIIGPGIHVNGTQVSGSTVVPFRRDGSDAIPQLGSSSQVLDSVIFGGIVGTGIKLYDHQVVGPYVQVKNNSEHDEGFFWGVAKETPIFFPHQGYTETAWAFSGSPEGLPQTPADYARLREMMRAVSFGRLVKAALNEEAPVSSSGAEFMVTFELDGKKISFPAQRINYGGGTINSDYSPTTGARASGVYYGGTATGVNAVPQYPAIFGSRSMLATLSQIGGEVEPGLLAMAAYDMRGKANGETGEVKVSKTNIPGFRSKEKGFTLPDDIAEKAPAQMQYFRHVALAAEVLAEGARRAADPFTLAGYAASLRAVQGAFSGIGPRYSKVLKPGLDVSLESLRKQLAEEKDGNRQVRLQARIKSQEALLKDRDQMVAEIGQIGSAITQAVQNVASVSQVSVAEAVRERILRPETPWVNPLAGKIQAGAEERRMPVGEAQAWLEGFVLESRGAEISFSGGVSRTGEAVGPRVLSGDRLTRQNIQDLLSSTEHASAIPGEVILRVNGANGNKVTVLPVAGAEEAKGAVPESVLPGRPVLGVPPALRAIETGLGGQISRDLRLGTEIYGPVFVDPTGLAVGVTLQTARDSKGRLMPQRFVAANEVQEQILLSVLAENRHSQVIRAWEYGGVEQAVQAAGKQLEAEGVIAWPVRDLPASSPELTAKLKELAALLEATTYDAEFAAKLAQKVCELFA